MHLLDLPRIIWKNFTDILDWWQYQPAYKWNTHAYSRVCLWVNHLKSHYKLTVKPKLTSQTGFVFLVKWYSNMHSSHFILSELLIHFWRHAWCTFLRLPEHKQGETVGESIWISQVSHWHIRQASMDVVDRLESHLSVAGGFGESAWRVSCKIVAKIVW